MSATNQFPDTDCAAWSPLPGLRRMAEQRWLIDGVLPQDSMTVLFGEPATFKSFTALDMACAIASGQPWQGRATERAIVIYLAAEGGNAIHLRRSGAQVARGITGPVPLALVQLRPRLDEPEGLAALAALVGNATDRDIARGVRRADEFLTDDERDAIEAEHTRGDIKNYKAIEEAERAMGLPRMAAAERAAYLALEAADDALPCSPFDRTHEADWWTIRHVLLVIDTYAQVAADDTKAIVSAYTRNLRDVQALAAKDGLGLSVLTIDHATKSGESFMGSLAKEGNADAMIRVDRAGGAMSLRLSCIKVKDAPDFEPIHLDMAPVVLDGFTDGYGRTLQTLRVADGERTAKLRRAV